MKVTLICFYYFLMERPLRAEHQGKLAAKAAFAAVKLAVKGGQALFIITILHHLIIVIIIVIIVIIIVICLFIIRLLLIIIISSRSNASRTLPNKE